MHASRVTLNVPQDIAIQCVVVLMLASAWLALPGGTKKRAESRSVMHVALHFMVSETHITCSMVTVCV